MDASQRQGITVSHRAGAAGQDHCEALTDEIIMDKARCAREVIA